MLRVDAPLLRVEAEARDVLALEPRGARRVDLPGDVDEAARAIRERADELVRVEAEPLAGGEGGGARARDLAGVRVDRPRVLAERKLDAGAVVDRPARRGHRKRLVVLLRGEAAERVRAHSLQPERARDHRGEDEHEDREQETQSPVRDLRRHFGGAEMSTYVNDAGSAGTSPRARAAVSIFAAAAALESRETRAALSARSCARSRASRSSARFRCSTATFSATTPARPIAATTIQTTPLAVRRLVAGRRLGAGRGSARRRTGAAATASDHDVIRFSPRPAAARTLPAGCARPPPASGARASRSARAG